jgi:hypothetical protein
MTKRERAVKDRAWLKMKVFSITKSLQRKLAADPSLTEEQKQWLAYIQNKALIGGREKPAFWVNVGRRYFKDKIIGPYRQWIDRLEAMGELDVNHSYKADGGKGNPKSFKVPMAALQSGTTKMEFQRKKIQPPRSKPLHSSDDVVADFVSENLRKLTVAESLVAGVDAITDSLIHDFCWRTFFGDFHLRRGNNCRRLYHTVIEMPKEGRANLRLADSSDELFEYDVKSCHPVLMLGLFTDSTERQRFAQLLDVDVYDGVAAVMNRPLCRDEVKQDFQEAVNTSDRRLETLKRKWVYRFFQQEFPEFTKQVLDTRSDLALALQNQEADLMVDQLGQWCRANGLFWIPCHDGWLSTASTERQISTKVRELFQAKVGYSVAVAKVELASRSTKLVLPLPSGSYVGVNDTSPADSINKVRQPPVSPVNPWLTTVEKWRKENPPAALQAAATGRSEQRRKQELTVKRKLLEKEASERLAQKLRRSVDKGRA